MEPAERFGFWSLPLCCVANVLRRVPVDVVLRLRVLSKEWNEELQRPLFFSSLDLSPRSGVRATPELFEAAVAAAQSCIVTADLSSCFGQGAGETFLTRERLLELAATNPGLRTLRVDSRTGRQTNTTKHRAGALTAEDAAEILHAAGSLTIDADVDCGDLDTARSILLRVGVFARLRVRYLMCDDNTVTHSNSIWKNLPPSAVNDFLADATQHSTLKGLDLYCIYTRGHRLNSLA